MTTIEEIHESLVNRQRRQMAQQIQDYGVGDFFPDYLNHLAQVFGFSGNPSVACIAYRYFVDAVISYHRIIGR
jgi:hypothetical protein